MKSYEDMVEALAKADSTEVVDNTSTDHAAVLIKNMFNSATDSVDLFTGCLNASLYERDYIINAGSAFISRGGKVRIVIQEDVADDLLKAHGFIKSLASACGNNRTENFTVSKLPPVARDNVKAHFLVKDRKGFRYETDLDKHEAVACFNSPDIASDLSNLFDTLVNNSTAVALH